MKILIVDDSTINNILLENLFSSYGYDTNSVLESDAVMDHIQSYQPDVILLDLMMPGLNGFDILKEMNKNNLDIPTIVLTAYKNQEYAKKAKALGARAYYTKPFNQEELIQTIQDITR